MSDKNEQAQQEQDITLDCHEPRLVDLSGLVMMQSIMAHPDDFMWLDRERVVQ